MKKLLIILFLLSSLFTKAQIGVSPGVIYVPASGCTDTDANDFITAAGITDATEKSAICALVSDLKTASLWTKFNAIYPFVGSSSTACKFNLIDPDDDDASFRLTFNGGWTFNSAGATPNGSTGYADTHIIPSAVMTLYDTHLSAFISNNTAKGLDMLVYSGGANNWLELGVRYDDGNLYSRNYDVTQGVSGFSNSDSRGLWVSSITASGNLVVYKNGSSLTTSSSTGGNLPSTYSIPIGAFNNLGVFSEFTNHSYIITTIGKGLTGADATAMYTIFNAFKTTLGR